MKLYAVQIQKGHLFAGWNGTEWTEYVGAGSMEAAQRKGLKAARLRINLRYREDETVRVKSVALVDDSLVL